MTQGIKKQDQATNFWFGFSLGIVFCSIGLYFFGTKNGRKTLKNLLEFTENLEENLSQVINEIEKNDQNIKKENKITTSIESIIDKVKTIASP